MGTGEVEKGFFDGEDMKVVMSDEDCNVRCMSRT